jgi:putative tryptophan/tyrosine transport system substrate-binding protein
MKALSTLALTILQIVAISSIAAQAQDQSKIARVGLLIPGSETTSRPYLEGLRQGLAERGLSEGKSLSLEFRYANGRIDELRSLADGLITSGVDLIFTGGDQAALAATRATDKIPIVVVACDALAAGLVTNLPRPGRNLTGVTCINADLEGKRVELIKEAIPSISRIGAVLDPRDKRMTAELEEAKLSAKANSIELLPLTVFAPEDIEPAFSKAAHAGINGVVVTFDSMTFFHRIKLAERNRVATIFNFREYVDAGGLISYGPNLRDMYRQSARHIQKILSGEAAGEIPMEQPVRFELVINLKTAKTLGLELLSALLARADEVIE